MTLLEPLGPFLSTPPPTVSLGSPRPLLPGMRANLREKAGARAGDCRLGGNLLPINLESPLAMALGKAADMATIHTMDSLM